jgi:hypothetical protein
VDTDLSQTGLGRSLVWMGRVRGGQYEKFEIKSLLGPDFFSESGLSMELIQSESRRITAMSFHETD